MAKVRLYNSRWHSIGVLLKDDNGDMRTFVLKSNEIIVVDEDRIGPNVKFYVDRGWVRIAKVQDEPEKKETQKRTRNKSANKNNNVEDSES